MRSGIGNSAGDPVFVSTVNGGSGGGGGPVTVADGADVAQGSTADAQATSGTGSWSIVALLKGLLTGVLAPIPAGTATIGKVNVTGAGGDAATAAYSTDNAVGGSTLGVRALAYLHGLNASGNADRITVRNPNNDALSAMNGAVNTYGLNAVFNGTTWDRLRGSMGGVWNDITAIFTDLNGAIAASATFTGSTRDTGAIPGGAGCRFKTFTADVISDASASLFINKSLDGTNWRVAGTVAIPANVNTTLTVPVTCRYYRLVIVNGTTAATTCLATCSLSI